MANGDRFRMPTGMLPVLREAGVDVEAVLERAQLPASVHNGEGEVTTAQFFAFWQAVSDIEPDPLLGIRLIHQGGKSPTPHPVQRATSTARDFRDAVVRLARYKRLCVPEEVRLEETKDICRIRFEWFYADRNPPAILTDRAFAFLLEMGRQGTGRRIDAAGLELTRPHHDPRGLEEEFGCRVRFGAPYDVLVLRQKDLDLPFLSQGSETDRVLLSQLERERQSAEAGDGIADRVGRVLRRRLASGRPELKTIARELRTSERTLQRQLNREGTNFQDLVNGTRQDLAKTYLADPRVELSEVAFLLGFEDSNSFFRAFRSWENSTPLEWRQGRVAAMA